MDEKERRHDGKARQLDEESFSQKKKVSNHLF